jgi:hypothetical protein
MTATEQKVRGMINETFAKEGLPLPFPGLPSSSANGSYDVELRESGSRPSYAQAREVFLQESGGGRRDYSELDRETQRIQREVLAHQLKLQEAAAADPSYQKEVRKHYKESMKRLAEIFCGEGKEHKKARKAFLEGRNAI